MIAVLAFNFQKAVDNDTYKCCKCGKSGVKLWSYILKLNEAWCFSCSVKEMGLQDLIINIDEEGKHFSYRCNEVETRSHYIGMCLPSIPSPQGRYCDWYETTKEGIEWWQKLPNGT